MKIPPEITPRPSGYLYSLYAFAAVGAITIIALPVFLFIQWKQSGMTIDDVNDTMIPLDSTLPEESIIEDVGIPNDSITIGEDTFGSYQEQRGVRFYPEAVPQGSLAIVWKQQPKKLTDVEAITLLSSIDEYGMINGAKVTREAYLAYLDDCFKEQTDKDKEENALSCKPIIYEAGVTQNGDPIYHFFMLDGGIAGPVFQLYLVWFDQQQKDFVLLGEHVVEEYQQQFYLHRPFLFKIIPYLVKELEPPQQIELKEHNLSLIYVKSNGLANYQFSFESPGAPRNRGGITDIENGLFSPVLDETQKVFTHEQYGKIYFVDSSYRIVLPDGSQHLYELKPYFFTVVTPEQAEKEFYTPGYITDITWNSVASRNRGKKFVIGGDIRTGGCAAGVVSCTNIVDGKDWFDASQLVELGKTKKGEPVYELKDKATNPYYKEVYDFGYSAARMTNANGSWKTEAEQAAFDALSDDQKYAEFIKDTPIFFWKDPMGHWRVYMRGDYRTLAECGKPVIYLYPETAQDVRVQVAPTGGFTKVEPAYPDDGWFVHAKPNGQLFNYADKTQYPYLFWEGHGYDYTKPSYGFVMKKEEVGEKMKHILATLGLNEIETADFLEFWQEKLEQAPYVFVTFLPQEQFDAMVPLTIEPTPDTVIRVFMDYTLLEQSITVQEPTLQTPKRNGFTVVEWGGVLHN